MICVFRLPKLNVEGSSLNGCPSSSGVAGVGRFCVLVPLHLLQARGREHGPPVIFSGSVSQGVRPESGVPVKSSV